MSSPINFCFGLNFCTCCYTLSNNKLVKTVIEAATPTGFSTGISWVAKRVYPETLQPFAHDKRIIPLKPKFSDFYQRSEQQKKGELMFAGAGALALGYTAFRLL